MTTHRQRIEACLRGEIVDRPPAALWRHYPVDDQSPETLAAAHVAFQNTYDFDLVKVTPASSFSVKDWGVDDVWEGNGDGTRRYSRYVIEEPSDWEQLEVLPPRSAHLAEQLDCLRMIRKELGPDTPILQTVFAPLAQAKHLAGDDLLLAHLRQFPDALEQGLQTIAETTRQFIAAAAKTGIDGIFYAVQHAQTGLLSRDEFVRFSRHNDMSLLQEAGGLWCNMVHVHGENVYLDLCADYSAGILNWHDREGGPSLVEARSHWGGAVCGGIGRTTLVYRPASAVMEEALDAMAQTAGKGLLLSTGCVAPIITPLGNLAAARRAVERWPGAAAGSD